MLTNCAPVRQNDVHGHFGSLHQVSRHDVASAFTKDTALLDVSPFTAGDTAEVRYDACYDAVPVVAGRCRV